MASGTSFHSQLAILLIRIIDITKCGKLLISLIRISDNQQFQLLQLRIVDINNQQLIIGEIFDSERGVLHFNASAGGDPLPISP